MTFESKKLIQSALDVSPTPLLQVDVEGTIVGANRACTPLLDYSPEELIGQSVEQLLPEAQQIAHRLYRRYFMADPVNRPMGDGREILARRRDGTTIPVAVHLSSLATDEGSFVVGALTDLTEQRQLEAQIRLQAQQLELAKCQLSEVAITDSLTGARNRVAFYEDLSTRLALSHRSGHALSVVLVNVDHFKSFNAEYGQQAGDDLLKRLAGLLRYTARRSDVVARCGADEFAVILPETSAAGARRCAERIHAAVQNIEWAYRQVTMRLGAATFDPAEVPIHAGSVDDLRRRLVEDATRALAHAKAQGRDRVTHVDEACGQ